MPYHWNAKFAHSIITGQNKFHAKWASGLHRMFWNWMKFDTMGNFTELWRMQNNFSKKSHQVWSYGRLKFAIFDRSASVNTVTFFLKPLIFQPLNGLECCKLLSMYLRGQGIQKTTSQVAKSTASYEKSGMKLLHMLFISITLTPYKKDREKIWKMKFSKYIP